MKKTPFNEVHRKLGAKMVDFGGWDMPVQYVGIVAEHKCVRENCGLFDVSHMGEVEVKGGNAEKFIQNLITNDVSKMEKNQCLYSPMLYENAGIVDDLLVYKINRNHFMIVVNASNVEKDFNWMKKQSIAGAELINLSDQTAELALQGPKAKDVLKKISNIEVDTLKTFYFTYAKVFDVDCIVSRTGYTGEDGFEIYFDAKHVTMFEKVLEAGKEFGILPIGLGARDTLRLEAGLMLYGNDMDQKTTPFEAPLKWTVKVETDFIGKQVLVTAPLVRKLVGFELLERAVPRHGNEVFINGQKFDVVTSGTFSPTLNKPIGLAFVPVDLETGSEIEIKIREGKMVKAKTCSHRFYKREKPKFT